MKKIVLTGIAALALAGTTVFYAQRADADSWFHHHMRWGGHSRMNPEDRLAFLDARIAAVKAGLKLTPDQEKLWPAVESAVRDFAKQRIDNANAKANTESADQQQQPEQDPIARLRERADRMGAASAGLKKIADAADPLYKTLDEGQKRRLTFLVHMGRHQHEGGWRERFMGRDRDHEGGSDRDFDRGMDHGQGREDGGRL